MAHFLPLQSLHPSDKAACKYLQEKAQLCKDLKMAKGIKQEVERMQADLIKSSRSLDAAPSHPAQGILPAPQISPASPPKTDSP